MAARALPIEQRRMLAGCKDGGVSLAVNGRAGRRVACVLDDRGLALEILDMEGEGEAEDTEGRESGT
jgi:anaphase-promoting complex subunit 4